ncbi:MAG: LysR family transcriptional regulator, partial [Leptolyngbya sp. SIO1D8]|nr:LysR family transcriptional regulator [Leptolyngbya sp. SIO1D8]
GVHRATVHRHIELLEGALSVKLFQRHPRGYNLTDEGREMLEVANRADQMFADLEGRTRKSAGQLSGELVVTAVEGIASIVMPSIKAMREKHPEIKIELCASEGFSRLEYGEAHIAFRLGPKPTDLDYVVRPFRRVRFGLFASNDYISRYGHPKDGDFKGHKFIGTVGEPSKRPYAQWLDANVASSALALKTSARVCIHEAILAGIGLGFMADYDAKNHPGLVEVIAPSDDISSIAWLVTHVDLNRTAKVQAFLDVLKSQPERLL